MIDKWHHLVWLYSHGFRKWNLYSFSFPLPLPLTLWCSIQLMINRDEQMSKIILPNLQNVMRSCMLNVAVHKPNWIYFYAHSHWLYYQGNGKKISKNGSFSWVFSFESFITCFMLFFQVVHIQQGKHCAGREFSSLQLLPKRFLSGSSRLGKSDIFYQSLIMVTLIDSDVFIEVIVSF